jgi:hypothetical protein
MVSSYTRWAQFPSELVKAAQLDPGLVAQLEACLGDEGARAAFKVRRPLHSPSVTQVTSFPFASS